MGLGIITQTASEDEEIYSGKALLRKPLWLEQRSKRKCANAGRACYVWILSSLCEHDRRD